MLDSFLEVAYEKDKQASIEAQVVENLKQLPNEELHKIVRGETKLAFHDPEGGCWLDQFKGTDLYQQALDLETQSLELDVQQQQQDRERRREDRAERDAVWDAKDALRVQKRMLELDLRKQEAGMASDAGGEELPQPPPEPAEEEETPVDEVVEEEEEADEKEAAVNELAGVRGDMVLASMRKQAEEELPVSMRVGKELGKTWLGSAVPAASGLVPGAAGVLGGGALGSVLAEGLGGPSAGPIGAGLGGAAGGMLGYMGGRGAARAVQGFGAGAVERKQKQLDKKGKKAKEGEKTSSAFGAADAWGREMAKAAADAAAEAAFEKLASGVDFEDLSEMEKEAILGALKAGLPAAQRFLGRAGKVLGKTYQGAGGGVAGIGAAAQKIPGLARGAASRVARSGVGQQIAGAARGGLEKLKGLVPAGAAMQAAG